MKGHRLVENYLYFEERIRQAGIDPYALYLGISKLIIVDISLDNEHLSPEWQQELGPNWQEIHARYLHTIGNLTLTEYNPELSDRPFAEKRDMEGGFRDSPIRLR